MTLKGLLIIAVVLAVLIGGLLTLRSSARTGMPTDEVLKRTTQRARDLEAQEKKDGES